MQGKRTRGFTLLEVMIVAVIVGVLAAIVLPAFQNQLRKQRRGTAESFLMDVAARQQTYLLDSRAYAGTAASCDTAGLTTLNVTVPEGVSDYYDVCVQQTGTTPPTFIAKASAKGGQVVDLGSGVDLSVDNAGNKLPAGKW